jgi:RNA polymerase sigma-70 factor (ECF subfamily)
VDAAELDRALPAALPRLRSLVARMIGNPDEAADVLQDALLKATTGIASFRGDAQLETWLFAVTTRAALDHLRARKRFRSQVMIDACDPAGAVEVAGTLADPSVQFDVNEHIAFCFQCIGRTLEPEASATIVLREVMELSNKEAADAIGLSEPVFRHELSAARKTMETEYEGLCALVNKNGACHQCRVLRDLSPSDRRGPELPAFPLPFEERLVTVRRARAGTSKYDGLRDYFFRVSTAMNDAR